MHKGGEVRRLHIIYFLSRLGRIEQPHLIRVHHLYRNGVYLRDVKRWMADLRGKDMPESFSWSYKRKYKNGYVWQDLLDDDLITPISDNEYVLKGSEIFPAISFDDDKKVSMLKNDKNVQVGNQIDDNQLQEKQESPDPSRIRIPTKAPSENYEGPPIFIFSSEESTSSDDLITKQEQDESKQGMDNFESLSSSCFRSNPLLGERNKKNKKTNIKEYNDSSSSIEKMDSLSSPFSLSPQSQFAKSKSHSTGASKMLRSLMTCGAVDTKDAALVAINVYSPSLNKADICSTRVLGTSWSQQQQYNSRRSSDGAKNSEKKQQSRFSNPKEVPAAYKPVGAPTCSQCGKSFKPEKLYTHMKACKGMKTSAKTAAASVRNPPPPSGNSMNHLMAIS
ncbi:hypothetical protein JCGZ_05254 [Jatropha curcas]|uniref:SOSEKI DIX-like domain-containing protein n=1 Tax=Jatropha curcas TaxID=180498 RepID=A0A067J9D7_JATCU|nr:protein UPSTREAM OF FLC isoform X1 [Jatropha curcas]KDP20371.1 hypothetical protein JCGZ_05254 [Jatropha curcas]